MLVSQDDPASAIVRPERAEFDVLPAGPLPPSPSELLSAPRMAQVLEQSSPAKVNLWLRILGKRDDGFHQVETRLCKVAVADTVTVEKLAGAARVDFTCSEPGLPLDDSNLAIKALRAFEARLGKQQAWRIHLEKRIPAGAGLGGGSSNAATVLRSLNALCDNRCRLLTCWNLALRSGLMSRVSCWKLRPLMARGAGSR